MEIDILGIGEALWASVSEQRFQKGGIFLYSGTPDGQTHKYGNGFILSRQVARSLMDWKPFTVRIITARFRTKVRNITIVQNHVPTDSADITNVFYQSLTATMSTIRRQDIVIVKGNFNHKVINNKRNNCTQKKIKFLN
jgi:hypothetical protein